MIVVAGSRKCFRDLASWCQVVRHLAADAHCRRISDQIAAAWQQLPDDFVRLEACEATLREFLAVCEIGRLRYKPRRGHRRGTKWERLSQYARNTLAAAARRRELEAVGFGHNSRRAA